MQLQVEGGDILNKAGAYLDECGIKDNAVLILDILDKTAVPSSGTGRAKRPQKEEPKIPILYMVRAYEVKTEGEDEELKEGD